MIVFLALVAVLVVSVATQGFTAAAAAMGVALAVMLAAIFDVAPWRAAWAAVGVTEVIMPQIRWACRTAPALPSPT